MGLIKKLNQNLRDNEFAKTYSNYVIKNYENLENNEINKLREIMIEISNTKRKDNAKEREKLVLSLFKILDYIDIGYCTYPDRTLL